MAIRVRNIKKESDIRRFSIDFQIHSASDSYTNTLMVPYRCKLIEIQVGATAAACQTVWTVTNVTRSAAIATAVSAAGLAAKGSVSIRVINSDSIISAGSIVDVKVSCTALALGYGSLVFEFEGNDKGDK